MSVYKRYFRQCLERLQIAHLAGKASECQSCMEKHLTILGTFPKKNKIDECNFVERKTWLLQLGNLGFFPPIFSLKQTQALVAPSLLGPVGMFWAVATEHQGIQGRDAPRDEVLLH